MDFALSFVPYGEKSGDLSSMSQESQEGDKDNFHEAGEDRFTTPVAHVRSLNQTRNEIFIRAVTREKDEHWLIQFEREKLRERKLREEWAARLLDDDDEDSGLDSPRSGKRKTPGRTPGKTRARRLPDSGRRVSVTESPPSARRGVSESPPTGRRRAISAESPPPVRQALDSPPLGKRRSSDVPPEEQKFPAPKEPSSEEQSPVPQEAQDISALIDLKQAKVAKDWSELLPHLQKLASRAESMTDAVAEAYQSGDTPAYIKAAKQIIKAAEELGLTGLKNAASEAESLGNQILSDPENVELLEKRVDMIIAIASQFDQLSSFITQS
jgi:HPt (histidine-containing phosphotransfer) domain-containing protein